MTTTPRTAVEALAGDPLVDAWRAFSDRFARGEGGDTPIRDAFAAGWDAARLTNEAADERLRAALEAVSPFDPNDRITAINGTVREPRTPADYVEAYRNRILQALANSEPKP